MESNTQNTSDLFANIRSGKVERDKAITAMYHDENLRNDVYRHVMRNHGAKGDAQSVFNQTLVQFVKTVLKRNDLVINVPINGYVLGIAKFVWLQELKVKKKHLSTEINESSFSPDVIEPESLVIKAEKKSLLHKLLSEMGEKCKEVLMHWAHGYRMNKIAEIMNYASDDMAKKKKYQCMKKLLAYIESNPSIKEALR